MAKSKSVSAPRGSGDGTSAAVIKELQGNLTDARNEAATLRTQVEALGHDVIRVRQFADSNRHEQVQAYRDACGAAVGALREIIERIPACPDGENQTITIPAAVFNRARHAVTAAKELP